MQSMKSVLERHANFFITNILIWLIIALFNKLPTIICFDIKIIKSIESILFDYDN